MRCPLGEPLGLAGRHEARAGRPLAPARISSRDDDALLLPEEVEESTCRSSTCFDRGREKESKKCAGLYTRARVKVRRSDGGAGVRERAMEKGRVESRERVGGKERGEGLNESINDWSRGKAVWVVFPRERGRGSKRATESVWNAWEGVIGVTGNSYFVRKIKCR